MQAPVDDSCRPPPACRLPWLQGRPDEDRYRRLHRPSVSRSSLMRSTQQFPHPRPAETGQLEHGVKGATTGLVPVEREFVGYPRGEKKPEPEPRKTLAKFRCCFRRAPLPDGCNRGIKRVWFGYRIPAGPSPQPRAVESAARCCNVRRNTVPMDHNPTRYGPFSMLFEASTDLIDQP